MLWRVFAGAVVLLIIGVLAAFYEEHLYQSQRQEAAREQAEILAASVTAALSFEDAAAASEYVRALEVNPAIGAVGIYAETGARIAGFKRDVYSSLPRTLIRPSTEPAPRSVVVPVIQRSVPLGWVYLQSSPEPIQNRASRYLVLALLAVMAVFVIVGMGSAQLRMQTQSETLADANGRLQEEIAERTKVEEALRQSQKMEALGQLSGGIAHDLNNHLMIIKGNLYLLRRKLGLATDEKYLVGADEGINRAAQLTQRVLGFSRKQSLNPIGLDLNGLVHDIEPLIRNSLGEHSTLSLDLNARANVVIDRNQMENVILNLAINARDAMPDGGTLTIATVNVTIEPETLAARNAHVGDFVRFTIADTGIGMPPEVREKALDPFFTTKPLGQGTGLGLSTAFGFITQSGGYLHLSSIPEQGTTITILLPQSAAAHQNPRMEA
jgi:signal transduction histidine kinase